MQLHLAADHNGFELKNNLAQWLKDEGHDVTDYGPATYEKEDDYPDYGFKVAEAVAHDPDQGRGIVICGSGVGMAVTADKVKGIRAALIHDPKIAESAQRDDNINVLALGSFHISLEQAQQVIKAWLGTPFSQAERHRRRIGKIQQYEEANR